MLNFFSESFPCLLGQQCSPTNCELSENILQNLLHNLLPQTVEEYDSFCRVCTIKWLDLGIRGEIKPPIYLAQEIHIPHIIKQVNVVTRAHGYLSVTRLTSRLSSHSSPPSLPEISTHDQIGAPSPPPRRCIETRLGPTNYPFIWAL